VETISVGWWWLGVALCLGALFLLIRRDHVEYRRQWTASGKSARAFYIHLARRLSITWLVIGVV